MSTDSDNSSEQLETNFGNAAYLLDILIDQATGEDNDYPEEDFLVLRNHFLNDPQTSHLGTRWLAGIRSFAQFLNFISDKWSGPGSYSERRKFLYSEFNPLLSYLEGFEINQEQNIYREGTNFQEVPLPQMEEFQNEMEPTTSLNDNQKSYFERNKPLLGLIAVLITGV